MRAAKEYIADEAHAKALGFAMGQTAHHCTGITGDHVARYRDEHRRFNVAMCGHEDAFRRAWWKGTTQPRDLEAMPKGQQPLKPIQRALAL